MSFHCKCNTDCCFWSEILVPRRDWISVNLNWKRKLFCCCFHWFVQYQSGLFPCLFLKDRSLRGVWFVYFLLNFDISNKQHVLQPSQLLVRAPPRKKNSTRPVVGGQGGSSDDLLSIGGGLNVWMYLLPHKNTILPLEWDWNERPVTSWETRPGSKMNVKVSRIIKESCLFVSIL